MADRSYDTELVSITSDEGVVLVDSLWSRKRRATLPTRSSTAARSTTSGTAPLTVSPGARTRWWLSRSTGSPATASNPDDDGICKKPLRRTQPWTLPLPRHWGESGTRLISKMGE